MPRPEKVQAVNEIKERLEKSEATFLTEYRGLSVKQQQKLRRGLREAGADYQVVKMTLARLAASELGLEGLNEVLAGPTALAFASSDPVPVAKVLKDFAKENESLVLKAGILSGEILAPEQVSKLADIESRDVLLSKIAGAAKAPLVKLAGMAGSFLRDTASMVSQLLEKKEAEAPAEDAPPQDEAAELPAPEEPVESAEEENADEAPSDAEPTATETSEPEEAELTEQEPGDEPSGSEEAEASDEEPAEAAVDTAEAAETDEPVGDTDKPETAEKAEEE